MIIRKAVLDDVKAIREISLDSSISSNSDEVTGFIDYKSPTEEGYVKRIENNPFFMLQRIKERS